MTIICQSNDRSNVKNNSSIILFNAYEDENVNVYGAKEIVLWISSSSEEFFRVKKVRNLVLVNNQKNTSEVSTTLQKYCEHLIASNKR